ncbi:MAG: Hsp70 family protein [Pirellulales bacterium]
MSAPLETEQLPSRFVVGIDLGTTNSAVAFVDTAQQPVRVQNFAIPQLVAPSQIEARDTLPSFHFEPTAAERSGGAYTLPWTSADCGHIVGFLARDQGETTPGRLVSSAKSWLCHGGVDRMADLLPWHGSPDVQRLSPVEASGRYLLHLRQAWNHRHPDNPLELQDVVLTLPASFDEVARELTVKAAARAGLPRVVLVEEPQAAFYAWIDAHGDDWEQTVRPGQKILICDVGGGTTDFTLIRVRRGEGENVRFHRVAVGEHLILGGDNLDLALAHHVERRVAGDGKLAPRQWSMLVQSCRRVKETLLGEQPPPRLKLNIAGSGAKLVGGSLQVELARDEVAQVLVEGFLPRVGLTDKPAARRSGFQEFGLPYAADAAITRYLAAFLTAHRHAGDTPDDTPASHDPARPDIVLFNGGFFESGQLRSRLLEVLCSWFPGQSTNAWQPLVLDNQRLDLAVARGAAYYGMVRRGIGVRISAGLARSYYIGVESDEAQPSAVCLAPAGVEEGATVDLPDRTFELLIRQPVEFPLYVSSTRLTDAAGAVVPFDRDQMSPLPPIRTVLQAGKKGAAAESLRVRLHTRLTEIGTLDVWCGEAQGDRTWRLQFDVRSATQTDRAGHQGAAEAEGFVDEATYQACVELLKKVLASGAAAPRELAEGLVKSLEKTIGQRRGEWPSSLLRRMWDVLLELEAGRRRGDVFEARWLYLVGFCLRPGYGLAVDDWRVAQTWRLFQGKRVLHAGPMCRVEWLILWRRIAGGLAAGQQRALADPLLANLRAALGAKTNRGGAAGVGSHEQSEIWRLLGSFELLPIAAKVELGDLLAGRIDREKAAAVRDAMIWTLGRLGAREPLYGPLNVVVPAEAAGRWLEELLGPRETDPVRQLAVMQLARRTGDRYRDLGDKPRDRAAAWLENTQASAHYQELVRSGGHLEAAETGLVFGESLPRGLRLAPG